MSSPTEPPTSSGQEVHLTAIQLEYQASLADPAKVIEISRRANGLVILNADHLCGESPALAVAKKIADPSASFEAGQKVYDTLYSIAAKARDEAMAYLLKEPGDGEVVFMVAGPGSGKSTFISQVWDAEFAVDSVHAYPHVLANRIQAVLDSGRTAQVIFILRTPGDAMRGNLERANYEKRMVSASRLGEDHTNARAAFREVRERFAGNRDVQIRVLESGTLVEMELELPQLTIEEAKRQAHEVLEAVRGGTDPRWIWGQLPQAIVRRGRGGKSSSSGGHRSGPSASSDSAVPATSAETDSGSTKPVAPPPQPPAELVPVGNTGSSRKRSPEEYDALVTRRQARIDEARVKLAAALAEAKRRGVPLHEILPVH